MFCKSTEQFYKQITALPCGKLNITHPCSQKLLPSLLTLWRPGGVSASLHSLAPLSPPSLLKLFHLEEKAPSLLSFSKKTYLNVTVSYYPNPFSHRHGHSQTDLLYPFSFLDFFVLWMMMMMMVAPGDWAFSLSLGLPGGAKVKNLSADVGDERDTCSIPGLGRPYPLNPRGRKWQATPVFLPGKFQG